jgi:hypothetical protein
MAARQTKLVKNILFIFLYPLFIIFYPLCEPILLLADSPGGGRQQRQGQGTRFTH